MKKQRVAIHLASVIEKVKVSQSCPTLCNPIDYTVHGILQARILEWVAFPFSRGSSQPRDQTQDSHIAGRFFSSWATREAIWCHINNTKLLIKWSPLNCKLLLGNFALGLNVSSATFVQIECMSYGEIKYEEPL